MIEGILAGLLQKYGVTPQHVQMTLKTIEAISRAVGEIEPFKASSGQVVAHFNKRMDSIDARLADIEACLQVLFMRHPHPQPQPEETDHERDDG